MRVVSTLVGAGLLLAAGFDASPSAEPARPATPVAAPRFTVAEAMRELDLFRPGRTKRAEEFAITISPEGSFRLSQHRGKVVMLNFWATWCPPCLEEMPALDRLYRRHRDAGFTLLAVSLDTDEAKVAPFVAKHGLAFPVGLDSKTKVAELYGVRHLPSTFVIDREGNIAAVALGPREWDNAASHALVQGLAR
jgi:peroxiredoxin